VSISCFIHLDDYDDDHRDDDDDDDIIYYCTNASALLSLLPVVTSVEWSASKSPLIF